MKRKLFTLAAMLTLVAFSLGVFAAPQYIETLQVGTITGATFTGLVIGTDVQAYNANLTSFATVAPAANMLTFLASATFASMAQDLSLEIGVDTQAYDADLDTYAGITPTATIQIALEHAADSVVLTQRHRMTVSEINAGHELLPAITGQSYRVIECIAIAYGGAVGTVTTVDILGTQSAGGVKIFTYAQVSLTQSAVLTGTADATVLADGASFSPMDVTTAITVGVTGAAADTATGIDFIITYVIE